MRWSVYVAGPGKWPAIVAGRFLSWRRMTLSLLQAKASTALESGPLSWSTCRAGVAILKTNTVDAQDAEMNIRPATEPDFAAMWPIFQQVVCDESTYVFAADTCYDDAFAYWFGPGILSFVAENEGRILGMYKLISNQRDLGDHVANASFMVSPDCSGRGIGRAMGLHCLQAARQSGYQAMQFNFVVSSNHAAVALWQKLGFSIVGRLPKVFRHKSQGLVDAYVMHRFLDDIG